MIQILVSQETYTYNAYHLVKAFYPAQEAQTRVEEKASTFVTVQFPDDWVTVDDTDFPSEDIRLLDKPVRKNRIDKALYQKLSARTGTTLPWGILTGVRPTKIAMGKLEAGMQGADFVPWFCADCLVSEEKAALSWEIVNREKALLAPLDLANGYSLYIGIPFCPTVCSYCSFSSGALSDYADRVEAYLDALVKELTFIGHAMCDRPVNTIYMGGGTPTTLTPKQLDRVLSCVDDHFPRTALQEYTVEAGRPDSITREKLDVLLQHGVTRISINPQSMQQKTLDAIGRKHTVADIRNAYALARSLGFDNINMDLIAGLPGETVEDMADTLAQIGELDPDSLTVHSLAIKRAARMGQAKRADPAKGNPADAKTVSRMIEAAAGQARQMGMTPYYLYRQKNIAGNFENVGYAKVDKAGIYNILIMEEKQSIVAAGAGAQTKLLIGETEGNASSGGQTVRLKRIENVKAIDAYIDRIDEMIQRKGEWLCRETRSR